MPPDAPKPSVASEASKTFIAADTQFILQLQSGDDEAMQVFDIFKRSRCYFVVSPTVMQELADIAQRESHEYSELAKGAIPSIVNCHMLLPPLGAVQHGIAEMFSRGLIARGVLSEDHYSDGLCIAEAAQMQALLFVTNQPEILGIENLGLYLFRSDLNQVMPASVSGIVEALDGVDEDTKMSSQEG